MLSIALGAIINKIEVTTEAAKKLGETAGKAIGNGFSSAIENASDASFRSKLGANVTMMGKVLKGQDVKDMTPEQKNTAQMTRMLSQGFESLGNTFKGLLTKSFDILETIYGELKKSSPLLQAVETLFNLAMQLFFMPLGNKLGELLIPAVIKLLDDVTAMWDAFGDMTLGEMFDHAIQWGIEALADFMEHIGDSLIEQGGWLADLGDVLKGLSSFFRNNFAGIVKTILSLVTTIVTHLGSMIGLIGTFMSLHYALQIATMAVIAASASMPWAAVAAGGIAAGVAIGGSALSWGIGAKIGLAEGGYVPATDGGQVHILGEGGEGEYVIPESKMGAFGGNTYNITVQSYSREETEHMIRNVVSGEISASRLRSGF